MSEEHKRQRLFTRRSLILGGLKASVLAVLAGRLYYLQILESDRYTTLAEDNRISLQLIPPSRGLIVDQKERPLAVNRNNFQVHFIPAEARDRDAVLGSLKKMLNLSDEVLSRVRKSIQRQRRFLPVIVADNLAWDQVTALELAAPDLPGVSVHKGEGRHYVLGPAAAHCLGYVAPVSEHDKLSQVEQDVALDLPDFNVGKIGLEKQYELRLRGQAGSRELEVNARGRIIRELSHQESHQGRQLKTCLDAHIQQVAYDRLSRERSGAAVVMNAHTGAVYAIASHPAYDPHEFTWGISEKRWDELLKDPTSPLLNKAIAGQYAPGSTFKMVVGLAALEAGVISSSHQVFCPGHMTLGNHRFHCWKQGGHGSVDIVQALAQSCDVFFYDVAQKVGIDRIAAMAKQLGLGSKTGIDLPGEKDGFIPSQEWKKKRFGVRWQVGESLIAGIGQGYTLVTPLQLAVMTACLVNGGKLVTPRLIQDVNEGGFSMPAPASAGLHPKNLALILEGMRAVTHDLRGTAVGSQLSDPSWTMGGKTGTSQVRRITMAERLRGVLKNDQLAWASRDHALFVGYGPDVSPEIVCAVVVEHGGGGSSVAAPIARDILKECRHLTVRAN